MNDENNKDGARSILSTPKMIAQGDAVSEDVTDLTEGNHQYRKGLIALASLIVVLNLAEELNPALLGVKLSVPVLWCLIGVWLLYFWVMWFITVNVPHDDGQFISKREIWWQAIARRHGSTTSKFKARFFFVRGLPIWAFIVGLLGVMYGLLEYYFCSEPILMYGVNDD